MKIGIVGYGKMGHEVERLALEVGHVVGWRLDEAENPEGCGLTHDLVAGVDVCVEFTTPRVAAANVRRILAEGGKVVCGTTGWFEALRSVQEAARGPAALVWGSNFSIGAYLFGVVAREAARRFASFPEYDVALHEIHHAAKVDHPSGTAKNLADQLVELLPHKRSVVSDLGEGARGPEALHVSSTRVGSVPGVHTVYFDGPFDTIEIRHCARSRAGFARGALLAAEWLLERTGFYRFEDVIHSLMEAR